MNAKTKSVVVEDDPHGTRRIVLPGVAAGTKMHLSRDKWGSFTAHVTRLVRGRCHMLAYMAGNEARLALGGDGYWSVWFDRACVELRGGADARAIADAFGLAHPDLPAAKVAA